MSKKSQPQICGVKIKQLKIINDQRGRLMEILRSDDALFEKFGQCYFTTAYPGVVKAWHHHRLQDDHFTCIKGKIRLALYDARKRSQTFGIINEFILSLEKPILVKIPKGVYHGFKAISKEEAMVINIPTKAYNYSKPDEWRIALDDPEINYDWGKL
jgi:dTDP-4-dehydrorhamnose 3,5-epimerase